MVLASMNDKLTTPATSDKARIWYPKAQAIYKLSEDIYGYIKELKSDLKKEAGLIKHDSGIESYREGDKNAVMHLFIKKKKGDELYQRLKEYRQDILAIDPEIHSQFANTLPINLGNKEDFSKTFFDDIPAVAAMAILSTFQNNIKIAENKTISFCHSHITARSPHSWPMGFAYQNITHPEPGESVEITAGIVSTILPPQTEVTVNGKRIQLGQDGLGTYKFQAANQPGKYVLPVTIKFVDLDGNPKSMTKNIEYTIGDNK